MAADPLSSRENGSLTCVGGSLPLGTERITEVVATEIIRQANPPPVARLRILKHQAHDVLTA